MLVNKLKTIWQTLKNNSFTLYDLQLIMSENLTILLLALEFMILNKTQILDRWGYVNYLYEQQGYFFITREYQTLIHPTMDLIVHENTSQTIFQQLDIYNYNEFINSSTQDIKNFETLSMNNKIQFLESHYFTKEYNDIINRYQKLFFKLDEIVINQSFEKKRGPKPAECKGVEFKTGKSIYINMLNLLKETNKHNLIPFYFKANTLLRIYDDGWRNATACETDIYTKELIRYNADRFSESQTKYNDLFGIDIGGEILIVYKEPSVTKTSKASTVSKTGVGRNEPRGRACESFNKNVLTMIAKELQINEEDIYEGDKVKNIDTLCKTIKHELIESDRMF